MSTFAIIIIVFVVLAVLLLVGGLIVGRRQREDHAGEIDQHIREADRALEEARARDKGWDRAVLEAAVTRAIEQERPGFVVDRLDLVLVDDPPGVTQDRAHVRASGPDGHLNVVLARSDAGWGAQSVS